MTAVFARRSGVKRGYPVAAAAVLLACAPVFLTAGFAVPFASAVGTSKFAGVATFNVDNKAGANGEGKVEVEHQEFALINTADITETHIGSTVYFDTETSVSIDSSSSSRPIAGVVTEIDSDMVWIMPAVA